MLELLWTHQTNNSVIYPHLNVDIANELSHFSYFCNDHCFRTMQVHEIKDVQSSTNIGVFTGHMDFKMIKIGKHKHQLAIP